MEQTHHHSNGRGSPQFVDETSTFNPNADAYRHPNSADKSFVRDNVYQMVAEPRGQVLIINNVNHAEANPNGGSYREDGERLMSTFKTLGFAIYKRDQFYDLSRRVSAETQAAVL